MRPAAAPDPPPAAPALPAVAGAGALLVGYNAGLNLARFPPAAYVPANLALAAGAILLGRRAGLSAADMGFARRQGRGLRLGAGLAGAIGAGLLAALHLPAAAPLLADERAAGLSGAALAYGAGIRIPLGTAVPEEVLFRGVLFGALRRRGMSWWGAAGWSSATFGLWHIGPTIVLARVNSLGSSAGAVTGVVGGAVALTTAAGMGFCLLRRWGGGVLAPVLAHSATNALGLLAAVAHQRATARKPDQLSWRLSSWRARLRRWTSSGPSARRKVRAWA